MPLSCGSPALTTQSTPSRTRSTSLSPSPRWRSRPGWRFRNRPDDEARAAEYADGPYKDVPDLSLKGLATLEPADADVGEVARAIVQVVDAPFGKRPFRMTVDPSSDGAEVVNMMADRVRAEMYRRIGLEDLLRPHVKS